MYAAFSNRKMASPPFLSSNRKMLTIFPLTPPQTPRKGLPTVAEIWGQFSASEDSLSHFATPCSICKTPKCRYAFQYRSRKQYMKVVHVADQKGVAKLQPVEKVIPAVSVACQHNPKIITAPAVTKVETTPSSSDRSSVGISPNATLAKVLPSSAEIWSKEGALAVWAKDNLQDETQFKLFAPYRGHHSIPTHIVDAVMKASNSDTRVFPHFPILPGELRNKIFNYVIEDELKKGRQVRVQYQAKSYNGRNHGVVACVSPPPALLSVCQESRSLVIPHYESLFSNPSQINQTGALQKHTVFNFNSDELFLHSTGVTMLLHNLVSLMSPHECAKVKHLVIPLKEFISDRSGERTYWGPLMAKFCNLESLKLMIGEGYLDKQFIRNKYLRDAKFVMEWYLEKQFPDKSKKAPKVTFQFVNTILAHALKIDELVFAGEGGFGPLKDGR
ncbi:hypothetical protein WAI453_010156 [Rhynchosporium graminicola]|uniref:2EXR domain-containing protein n=1 Tax=Rhynchosporium graminicola TaxID=2792576 RepID=A0A1E1KFL8_9HELO|nr:uncharacterized protein RCO7_02600 [Rhynchosporium commune]